MRPPTPQEESWTFFVFFFNFVCHVLYAHDVTCHGREKPCRRRWTGASPLPVLLRSRRDSGFFFARLTDPSGWHAHAWQNVRPAVLPCSHARANLPCEAATACVRPWLALHRPCPCRARGEMEQDLLTETSISHWKKCIVFLFPSLMRMYNM